MATELANLTSTELAAPINRVAFSSYAQIAGDVAELRRHFLDVSSIIWAVGLPAAIGIGLCSRGIVRLLLGPQWLGAAPVVSILAIGAALDVMVANTHTVYWTTGGSRLVTKLSATGMLIFVPALVILTRAYGLIGAAVAYTLTAAALLPLNYRFLMRTLSLGLGRIAARNWRVVAACACMAAATYPVSRHMPVTTAATALAQLIRAVPVGVATYVIALQLIWTLAGRPPGPEVAINGAVRRTLSALMSGTASRF